MIDAGTLDLWAATTQWPDSMLHNKPWPKYSPAPFGVVDLALSREAPQFCMFWLLRE